MHADEHRPTPRSRATWPARAGAALLLAATIAGCGGGSEATPATAERAVDAPPSAPAADPCRFLTAADLTAAGLAGSAPQPVETASGAQGCTYSGDGFTAVQVLVQPGGGADYFSQSKDLLSAPQALAGFGDEAVLDAANPQQVTVLVRTGDTVVTVGGSVTADAARTLAQLALTRV